MAGKYGKTREIYITGKVAWVKANQLNKFGKWSVQIHPIPADVDRIRELQVEGLKNVMKKDEDGYFVNFSREPTKMILGALRNFPPPIVLDGKKKKEDGTFEPLQENIGNGSDGIIKLEVYGHGTPNGGSSIAARWESIRVDNLVPYEPVRDFTTDEKEQIGALPNQPEQLF